MNRKVKHLILFLLGITPIFLVGQEVRTLSLQECMEQAVLIHPLYNQHQLQTQASFLKTENLKKEVLPSVSLNGKATLQNEVINLPFSLPGVVIPTASKDQYRLTLDLNQPIYRGGISKYQNQMESDALLMNYMQTDVELYSVKSQVKSLYFQLILTEKQKEIIAAYQEILNQKLNELKVLVKEGVALESTLDVLKLEYLNSTQQLDNLIIIQKSLRASLKELTQLEITPTTHLTLPEVNILPMQKQDRFEYHLLSLKQQQLETSKNLLDARNRPMLFAFASGGFGRPGFNMLSNSFDDVFIVGLNLKWNLWDWNKNKNDKKMVDVSQQLIETQKQSFVLNIQLGLNKLQADIEQQKSLLDKDPELLSLHESVVKTAEAQFNNGTLTSFDYVMELQKLNQARLNFELHRIGLLSSQLAYLELLGKL